MKQILSIILLCLLSISVWATGTVTLAWDPSSGTNVITNYKVYYGVATRTYTNTASAGTNLTVSIPNLVSGTTYYFAATATDNNGLESDYSTEVSTFMPYPRVKPNPPGGMRIVSIGP